MAGRTDNACWRRSKTLAAMERGTHRPLTAMRGSGGRFMPANTARSGTPLGRPAAPSSATGGEVPTEPDSAADWSAEGRTVSDGKGGGLEAAVSQSVAEEPLSGDGQGVAGSAETADDQCGGEPCTEPASTTGGAADKSTGPCQGQGNAEASQPSDRKRGRGRSQGMRKTAQSSAARAGEQHAAEEPTGKKRGRGRSKGASRTAQSSAPSIGQHDAADAGVGAAPNPLEEEHAEMHGADGERAEAGKTRKKPRSRTKTSGSLACGWKKGSL